MKKISIIILLCLIMSVIVSCGKDNDVKDTHNTSNDNLNSEIENLNSQVAELQSQINELTSDPYNETVDEMYYEFELDGEMYVTKGSSYCTEIKNIEEDKYYSWRYKIQFSNCTLNIMPKNEIKFNEDISFYSKINDNFNNNEIRIVIKKINNIIYIYLNMNDLRTLGLI